MGVLHINLLDTQFSIQANDDEEHLEKLLGYYSRIVQDVEKIDSVKTPLQVSILAGILLCDELYKAKSNLISLQNGTDIQLENGKNTEELERLTKAMIDKINKAL